MTDDNKIYAAFWGHKNLAQGPAALVRNKMASVPTDNLTPILVFDRASGKQTDVPHPATNLSTIKPTKIGRPKLGVAAKEVTLLPRHWDWLARQQGGASATLRALVEAAMKAPMDPKMAAKAAQTRAYHFMSAIAGDFAGFEEASRALFASDMANFSALIKDWPDDIVIFIAQLLKTDQADTTG